MALTAALTVGMLAACAPTSSPESGKVAVRAGQDATLTVEGGSLTVDVPGASISGEGVLSASRVVRDDGTDGWNVEMSEGAQLTGPAQLHFAGALGEGEPLPLVTSTEDGENFVPAEEITATPDGFTVTTTHFSTWFTARWSDILSGARDLLDHIYRNAGAPPTCANEAGPRAAGYDITSDSGNLVFWCVGEGADGSPQLKVANGRGYALAVEHTPGMTLTQGGPKSIVDNLTSWLKEAPTKPENTVTLLGSGDTAEYSLTGDTAMGVMVRPSFGGFLRSAGEFTVETLAMVLTKTGNSAKAAQAGSFFEWASCLKDLDDHATSDAPETSLQAAGMIQQAIGMTMGCLEPAIKKAGLGFWGTAFLGAMTWFVSGVTTAANALGAAADSALNLAGYKIIVTPPKRADGDSAWLITAEGVGPIRLGHITEDFAQVRERRMSCSGADVAWSVAGSPNGNLGGGERGPWIQVSRGSDVANDVPAPRTKGGITLGSTVSTLQAAGFHSNVDSDFWWGSVDGVTLTAVVADTPGSSEKTVVTLVLGSEKLGLYDCG